MVQRLAVIWEVWDRHLCRDHSPKFQLCKQCFSMLLHTSGQHFLDTRCCILLHFFALRACLLHCYHRSIDVRPEYQRIYNLQEQRMPKSEYNHFASPGSHRNDLINARTTVRLIGHAQCVLICLLNNHLPINEMRHGVIKLSLIDPYRVASRKSPKEAPRETLG